MPARRPLSRAVILLLALLSAVVLGVGQEATCEMHGGVAAGSVASGERHHHADARAATTAHGPHARHDSGSSRQDSHRCDCTCIGDCSAIAPVASLPAATTVRVATIAAEPRLDPEGRSAVAPPPANAHRRLPFANGPPATRLS